ncbi:MAG: 3-methyladenine DNA glycosylase [Verrucomicrobiota bacterium]
MSVEPASQVVLGSAEWRARRAAHEARADRLVEARRERAQKGERDPVEDFLFTYYPFRFSAVRRWTPGAGVALADADELVDDRRFLRGSDGLVRVGLPDAAQAGRLAFSRKLCRAVATRAAFHGCFGLHEWAMVYGQAEQRRHGAWPLRLGAEGTDAVVRAMPVRCTHYDAFRFFTPGARPLNKLAPTLEARVDNEQPGCVHVTMDLFKWAMKAQPWVSAELAADAFELAHVARTVDMRASPYDFSAIGLKPIAIETAEGRSEYETEQRRLSALAEPVRARLIAELERALA